MIGTTLGRYRITAKLGEGGMGSVWRADDTLLGRPVALKLLAPHLASSDAARQRFIREARAASRLEHPGIATVYDAGEIDGHVFIAYQLIEGETLATRLTDGPLPLPDLFRLARGTAEALAHAHGRGVLHRDLTAGNVMLRGDGSPVIVDFGLARTRGDATLTSTGTTLGTAPYLAPEQWRGEVGDARTDLWSLGVVLYYAATRQQPFGSELPGAVMYRALNDEPVRPSKVRSELPAEFERPVLRLLEKDPRDRLASAAELAKGLRALDDTEVAPVAGEALSARLRRWWRRQARRRLKPAHVAAMGTAVLVLVAAALLVRQRIERAHLRVLAVMPLRNASTNLEESAYIGEGLGEELVRRLGVAGRFRILPWSTTSRFGESRDQPTRLAAQLGADVMLNGSFKVDGERVEVLAELVDGRSGLQLWANRYTRSAAELIGLQTDIALDVAQRVDPSFKPGDRARLAGSAPSNPEAYDYYVRGANYWHSNDPATQALAEPFFAKAVGLDSTLAVAWVGLGAIRTSRVLGGEGGEHDLGEAESYFRRALALEPGLPVAERGLIRVITERGGPERDAAEIAAAALRRDPDGLESLITAGWGFVIGSVPELAVRVLDRAFALDPGNPSVAYYRVYALCWDAQFARCLETGREYVRRHGEDVGIYFQLGSSAGALGHEAEATAYLERAVELDRSSPPPHMAETGLYLAAWYRTIGQREQSNALLDSIETPVRAAIAAQPDNFRLWSVLLGVLAERSDGLGFDRVWEEAVPLRTRTTEASYLVPIVLAQSGDLARAQRLLAGIQDPTAMFWDAKMVENGAHFTGGMIPDLFTSPEYQVLRTRMQAERARRLALYTPLVDRATRGGAGFRPAR